ncbi:MAG: hypothetical protein JXB32_04570 [Deltaproteobacteria bacterium]|nr:hypothetical protein [Deltaproteobacteria bacterium]
MRPPHHRPWLALPAAAALLAGPATASADALAVRTTGNVAPDALVEGVRLRVLGPVELRPDAAPGDGLWILDVAESPDGTRLVLSAPDGTVHERLVPPGRTADGAERVRELSLQVGFLAEQAAAPFAQAVRLPPPPRPPPDDDPIELPLELALLGAGDAWGDAQGEDLAFWLLARFGLRWNWNLWTHVELGWQRLTARGHSDVAIDTIPIRLGVGADILWESWEFRAALQAIAEYWMVSGEALHPSGWRGGAGLLVVGGYRIVPWCSVGLEAGLDLTPRAVQIDYHDAPVLALGQLRWRAGVWVGFDLAGL